MSNASEAGKKRDVESGDCVVGAGKGQESELRTCAHKVQYRVLLHVANGEFFQAG